MSLHERFGDSFIWGLKYRGKTIDELILPERLKTYFKQMVESGNIPNMLLSGSAGTGKTSVSIAIADAIKSDVLYLNGSEETSIDVIRTKLMQFCSSMSMFNEGKKIVIYDEFDRISPQAADSIKSFLEQFSKSASFIFISNHKNKIIEPLKSRLQSVDFVFTKEEIVELRKEFFKKVLDILKVEEVQCEPKVVGHIVKQFFPDMRKILNELQKYGSQDKLQDLSLIKSFNGDIENYYKLLKERDFFGIQQYVSLITDHNSFFTTLYDTGHIVVETDTLPNFILLLNDHADKSSRVLDQRINLMAMSIEFMNNVTLKKG
jgi:DNA polymerase III delta prime subunit